MKSDSFDCVVTSPPYYGLRDYGVSGQIGLEERPSQYLAHMAMIFEQVKRVLKPSGTLWLNIGDSYGANYRCGGNRTFSSKQKSNRGSDPTMRRNGSPSKQLLGVPWRLAFLLQESGWILRQDIIWHKPNPMPESVRDRCTKSHEYVFMFARSRTYFYDIDLIKEPSVSAKESKWAHNTSISGITRKSGKSTRRFSDKEEQCSLMRTKRSVWTVAPAQFREAHFATFPEKLIEPMILAGCPKDGTVLDPFAGAGTTGVVCKKHGRRFVGIELNKEYAQIAEKRIEASAG